MSDTNTPTPSPAELLSELEASGLTIATLARERGISSWKLYAARRRARKERVAARDRFVAMTVQDIRRVTSRVA